VATNGSQPAIEQARTIPENAYPTGTGSPPPQTVGEDNAVNNAPDNAYQQLADVVILTSLTIAGCTLATGVAGGSRPPAMSPADCSRTVLRWRRRHNRT
jgi:hypothetical protein